MPEITPATLERDGWVRNDDISDFTRHVGPTWRKDDGPGRRRVGFIVDTKHDNSHARAHGGMIMSLCDDGMGTTAARARPGEQLFTVSFECQFISGAEKGEFVVAHCEVMRATGSLMFMRGECRVGDRLVATCSGIWKVLGKRRTAAEAT